MAKLLEAVRFVDMDTGCSYRYVSSKTERFKLHTHDYYEIFVMLEGEVKHLINGEEMKICEGDAVFIRASDTHNYIPITDDDFSFLNITFTKETLDEVFAYLGEGYSRRALVKSKSAPLVSLNDGEFQMMNSEMEKIRAILPEDSGKRKTALRILIMKFFSDVFSGYVPQEKETPLWLITLMEKMKSDMNFEGGISRMVTLSGKSREHLTRSMKKYIGKTPSEFINELRLNYIANMLKNSNHKILDIILDSGFNTVSYASGLFYKRYGMNMSDFRKNPTATRTK